MRIDVHTFVGPYPFRHLPHPDPDALVGVMRREGIDAAWVGHLPTAFHRDPHPGNDVLFTLVDPHRRQLRPTPVVRPDWPRWERTLADLVARGVPAIRAYPQCWGLGPDDPSMKRLAHACAAAKVSLVLTVRFEDLRQRHALDVAGDLSAAAIRALARERSGVRLIVLGGGRELIEETHWGLTPDERDDVYFDFSWVWGPPDDDLAHLFRAIGSERFVFGSAWPLRLAQSARANLALLPDELQGCVLADPGGW